MGEFFYQNNPLVSFILHKWRIYKRFSDFGVNEDSHKWLNIRLNEVHSS